MTRFRICQIHRFKCRGEQHSLSAILLVSYVGLPSATTCYQVQPEHGGKSTELMVGSSRILTVPDVHPVSRECAPFPVQQLSLDYQKGRVVAEQ